MFWADKRCPIVDLKIYTKDRLFRVPGSSKWEEYTQIPMPTRQFFMNTRMADRYVRPDITTDQVSLLQSNCVPHQNASRPCSWKRPLMKQEGLKENKLGTRGDSTCSTISKRMRLTRPIPEYLSKPSSFVKLGIPAGSASRNENCLNTQPRPEKTH